MNKRTQAQWAVSGIIEAPVEAVWKVLIESDIMLSANDKAAIIGEGRPDIVTTSIGQPGAGKVSIEADKRNHWISTQGEWWYRGVYAVEPDERGSLLAYRVYNIAPGVGWWAAQLVQGPQHARTMQTVLHEQLRTISERLGCTFHENNGK